MARTRYQNHQIITEVHDYGLLLENREIFLYGHGSNDEDETDHRMSMSFVKNLRLLENISSEPIIIHQQNYGGDVASGYTIYESIKNSSCWITLIMYGAACSMGSVIPQAADLRIIADNCIFMVHEGTIEISSTLTTSDQWTSFMKDRQIDLTALYAEKCIDGEYFASGNPDIRKVKKFITSQLRSKQDWIMTSEEAVHYGFADGVLGKEPYVNIETIKKMSI